MFERPIYRRRPDAKADEPPKEMAAATVATATATAPSSETAIKPTKPSGSFNNPFAQLAELMNDETKEKHE
jgi:hypothetical protein